MHIDLPQNVNFIIDRLYEHGFEAYAVGGCVRDSLLGRNHRTGILPLQQNRIRLRQFSITRSIPESSMEQLQLCLIMWVMRLQHTG